MSDQQQEIAETPYAELAAGTLKGELMAITLDELKAADDVWHKISQDDQDGVIERIEKRVRNAVTQTIRLLSSHGFARVPAKLDSLTVKDGIKAVASVSMTDPSRHELIDATGSIVTLVIADLSQFTESPHGHKAEPDQSELRLQQELGGIFDKARNEADGEQPDNGAGEGDAPAGDGGDGQE